MTVLFTSEDIAGALSDVGVEVTLGDGRTLTGFYQGNFHEQDLADGRIEGMKQTLMVASSDVTLFALRRGTTLTIGADAFAIRSVQNSTPGFSLIILGDR